MSNMIWEATQRLRPRRLNSNALTEEHDDVVGDRAAVVDLAAGQAIYHRLLHTGPGSGRAGAALGPLAAALHADAVDGLRRLRILAAHRSSSSVIVVRIAAVSCLKSHVGHLLLWHQSANLQ